MNQLNPRMIKCPKCQTECEYSPRNEFRPFCSSRCKNNDILAWSEEEYTVEGPQATPEEVLEEIQGKN